MNHQPIRAKIQFIAFGLAGIMLIFGYFSLQALKSNKYLRQSLRYSYSIESHIKSVINQKYSDYRFKGLQKIRKEQINKTRARLLSDVIQSFSAGDQKNLTQRVHRISRYEVRHRYDISLKLAESERELENIIISLVVFSTLIIAIIPIVLSTQVFTPMKRLAQRMSDFIYSRYTYEMISPDKTEIGQLHGTFNSLAEKVVNTVDKLKALDEAKTDFLNIASHELRTPMTSIKGSLSLLSKGIVGELDDKAKNLVHIAEGESDRLIRLINDLLDLAKLDANQLSLKPKWVNIHQIVDTTIQGLTGFCQQADVTIEDHLPRNIQACVDADRIAQVLTNFLSNAIKYSDKGGKVTIKCSTSGKNLRIDVIDNGPGIGPNDQEKIFDKFRQISGPNNPLVKGTGLGLAIAKAIIEEHNGTLGLQSTLGKGSTFYFTLPQWKEQAQPNKRAAA